MANVPEPTDYRNARIYSAALLFVLASVLAVLDVSSSSYEVNPIVYLGILGVAAALLGVKIPGAGRGA